METKVIGFRAVNNPPDNPQLIFDLEFQDFDQFIKADGKTEGYKLKYWKPRERSLNANAYMWVLCDKIAKKIGVSKEDVYRKAVREVGMFFDTPPMPAAEADELAAGWEHNGIGWFCEDIFRTEETAMLRIFTGSSVYDGQRMSRLVDYIVGDATDLGIETMSPEEIEHMKQLWGGE